MALLSRVNKLQKYLPAWYSAMYSWPHFDVLYQIVAAIWDLPFHIKCKYTPKVQTTSEADDTPPGTQASDCAGDLPQDIHHEELAANLSFQLAKHAALGARRLQLDPVFYPLPHSNAYIIHQNRFLTAYEPSTLRHFYQCLELHRYFNEKYKWEDGTLENGDWDALHTARNKLSQMRAFITKQLIGWLPTNSHLSKTEQISPMCHFCTLPETTTHIIQCCSRWEWKESFRKRLRQHLKKLKTAPPLEVQIMHHVTNTLAGIQDTRKSRDAAQHQQRIGWPMMMRGLLSKTWRQQQDNYAWQILHHSFEKRRQWAPQVVRFILEATHEAWLIHNHQVHQRTSQQESQQTRLHAEASIRALYQRIDEIHPCNQKRLFPIPLEDFFHQHNATYLMKWYETTLPSFHRARQDYAAHPRENQDIRDFFQPLQNTHRIRHNNSISSTTANHDHPV